MANPDDRALLHAAAAGDHLAVEAVVRRHSALVLTACRRQLPGIAADEAAQATFVILWRRAARAAAAPSLESWLLVTAQRVCATARRAHARRRKAERGASMPTDSEVLPNEARALLDQALADLPATERDAVIRRHLLGEDPATAARVLGCAEGTVHSRTSRGLDRLRTWFARRRIACSVATLTAAFAHEMAAADQLSATAAQTCATPTATAQTLAAAAATSHPAIIGMIAMTLLALTCAAIVALASPAAVAPDVAPPMPASHADEPTVRLYDVTGLYRPEIVVDYANPQSAWRSPTGAPPLPPADPANVAALDNGRTLAALCAHIQGRLGAAAIARFIDEGMTDDDLLTGITLPDSARSIMLTELRRSLANGAGPYFPGLDVPRTLLVSATQAEHARLEADLQAVRQVREQRLCTDPELLAASKAFKSAATATFGSDWLSRSDAGPLIARTAAPVHLAEPIRHRFAVIWLPEGCCSERPLAVATNGTDCLIANNRGIVWRSGVRPAAIALALRQDLDRGTLHAPLTDLDWLSAAHRSLPDEHWNSDHRTLYNDLTDLVQRAQTAGASGF